MQKVCYITKVIGRSAVVNKQERLGRRYFVNAIIKQLEQEAMKTNLTPFNVGDTVKVYVKVIEGERERIQAYEGVCIAKKNSGIRENFTVRRVSFGIGVERTFPIHSPKIDKIEVIRRGSVRRAKLYYLRDLSGKAAKIKEKR